MNETTKTLAFLAAGAIAVTSAYFIDTGTQLEKPEQFVGKTLNDGFAVDAPQRLRIIRFDRPTASTRQFEVAAIDGVWSIPSKQNYPADATQQMAAAATALVDRKILRVAAETAEAHEELGVLDPQSAKLESNSAGIGARVQMFDANDKTLVDMVIGKKVKDAEGQRYVRNIRQEVVYVVELDPDSLSTNFEDWIEDDLLKLNPFDIRQVFINDYSAELNVGLTPDGRLARQVGWDRRGQFTLSYDNDGAKWRLDDAKKFGPRQEAPIDDKLAGDEEVNQDALGELRTALDELLIVDVAQKPEGLSDDLKAGEDFLADEEAIRDLIAKGFAPVGMKPNAPPEILSSEGEVIATQRDGVEYVLRFGKLMIRAEGDDAAPEDPDAEDPDAEDPAADETPAADGEPASAAAADAKPAPSGDEKNLRRYLFVMARFNEEAIDKPELKELPQLPADAETPPAEAPPAETPPAEAADASAAGAADAPAEGEEAEAQPANAAAAEGKPADAPSAERNAILAERKLIEEENKRLEEQYQESLEAGKKRVAELNGRFGDWYYVISNDVFKKIHLGRKEAIRKQQAPAAGAAAPQGENPLSGLPNLPGIVSPPPASESAPTEPSAEPPAEEELTEPPAEESPEPPAKESAPAEQ